MRNNIPAGQVFYLHTEPEEKGYQHLGNRATIALKRVDGVILWGLAICGDGDNFEKKTGREIALERLNEGFGRIMDNGHFASYETESELLLGHANGIAAKVSGNYNKWKHRINAYRENLLATAEAVPA